jgi:hypothetical protein
VQLRGPWLLLRQPLRLEGLLEYPEILWLNVLPSIGPVRVMMVEMGFKDAMSVWYGTAFHCVAFGFTDG